MEVTTTAAWHEQRRNYLTASEVSAVLGTCKYRTSEELMKQKIERIQIPDNPAMAHGRHYEDEALDLFVQVRSLFVSLLVNSGQWTGC